MSQSDGRLPYPLPALKDGFPVVTSAILRKTCDEVLDFGLGLINSKLYYDNKMPYRSAMTEDLIYRLRAVGGMIVGYYSGVEEGNTGVDVYIKATFAKEKDLFTTEGPTKTDLDDKNDDKNDTDGSEMPNNSAPSAAPEQKVTMESKEMTRYIIAIQTKPSKPIGQADADSEEQPKKEEAKPVVQESKYPQDDKWEIDFTYKDKTATQLQMYLLQNYVAELYREHGSKDTAIMGGYLIYTHKGYIWIPVEQVVQKYEEIATHEKVECDNSRRLNRQLTHYFLNQQSDPKNKLLRPSEAGNEEKSHASDTEKCFLEEMMDSPRFVLATEGAA